MELYSVPGPSRMRPLVCSATCRMIPYPCKSSPASESSIWNAAEGSGSSRRLGIIDNQYIDPRLYYQSPKFATLRVPKVARGFNPNQTCPNVPRTAGAFDFPLKC